VLPVTSRLAAASFVGALGLQILAGPLFAEDPPNSALAGAEILARMVEMETARTAELRQYVALRRYALENKRFHKTAAATLRMTWRQPGDKQFEVLSESGPSLIHERVLRRMVDSEVEASREPLRQAAQFTPANYNFRFLGADSDRGRRAWLFEITPKVESKFMVKGRVWLDAEDFAITRIEGKPARNPSFWIRHSSFVHTYEKQGGFWLASSNIVDSDSVFFGRTSVEIHYTDYVINPGETIPRP
jgi:hypothetical protein